MERDLSRLLFWEDEPISTHTLTWSVTDDIADWEEKLKISTHTLTWSVTWDDENEKWIPTFQLTRSRGA